MLVLKQVERIVSLHDRASAEQLSLDLGESNDSTLTISAAKIRRLYTEVGSLAAVLSSGIKALKTNIAAMEAARNTPVRPEIGPELPTSVPIFSKKWPYFSN